MGNDKIRIVSKQSTHTSANSIEPESGSLELSSDITAELNDNGELIGIEILNANAFIQDAILESSAAKLLSLAKAQTS